MFLFHLRLTRKIITHLACVCVLFITPHMLAAAQHQDDKLVVTILGSGTPVPSATQFGPSILVQAGGNSYVFDCGRGCTSRLAQVDISLLKKVERLFITHLHSDHITGIPDLWLNGWVQQRKHPLSIWGPIGTANMMFHLRQAYSTDINIRRADNVPKKGPGLDDSIIELTPQGGVLLEENGVKITAFAVEHGPVKPAYGFKVEYAGKSVMISGDTTLTPNLFTHANNADVVMLEVMSPALINFLQNHFIAEQVKRIRSYHLTASQAAQVFVKSKPKLGVYYHTRNGKTFLASLLEQTKAIYEGPLVVGEDLMQITIGEEVVVKRLGQ